MDSPAQMFANVLFKLWKKAVKGGTMWAHPHPSSQPNTFVCCRGGRVGFSKTLPTGLGSRAKVRMARGIYFFIRLHMYIYIYVYTWTDIPMGPTAVPLKDPWRWRPTSLRPKQICSSGVVRKASTTELLAPSPICKDVHIHQYVQKMCSSIYVHMHSHAHACYNFLHRSLFRRKHLQI